MSICEARIRRIFDVFDYNRKGFITLDELERLLRAFGLADASKQVVAGFMRTTVATGTSVNEVSFEDTKRMLQQNYTSGNTEEMWYVYKILDAESRSRLSAKNLAAAAATTPCFDSYLRVPAEQPHVTGTPPRPKKQQVEPPTFQVIELAPKSEANEEASMLSAAEPPAEGATPPPPAPEAPPAPQPMARKEPVAGYGQWPDTIDLPPISVKKLRRFEQFVYAAAEYPDKGITFEEWRRVQLEAHEEQEEMEAAQQEKAAQREKLEQENKIHSASFTGSIPNSVNTSPRPKAEKTEVFEY